MKQEHVGIGNPVDTWWTSIRREILPCIEMIGQFPPAQNANNALDKLPDVRRAHQTIRETEYPPQAKAIRNYLLECLYELAQCLKELAIEGSMTHSSSYNIAYHNYMMATHLLLQRGIYEPDPTRYTNQVH